MKHNMLYHALLPVVLLAGSMVANAQTQERNYYTMDRVKANNPWSTSYNAAGLVFNVAEDYSIVEGKFGYEEGSFRNVFSASGQNQANLFTESFRKVKNVYFYGMFDFKYSNRRNKSWSSVLDPYDGPRFLADSTPGSQRLEQYRLSGGVGYLVGKHFIIGGKFGYEVASNAKRKDIRNKNDFMNLHFAPGIAYQSKFIRAGINFTYEKKTEQVNVTMMGDGNSLTLYDFEGMWFHTSASMKKGDQEIYDYKNYTLGGAAQLEFFGNTWRFFNQFAGTQRNQEIFRSNKGDDRNGEMKERNYNYNGSFNRKGEKYSHYIEVAANFTTQLGFDNIQRKELIDNHTEWVQYGKKNKTTFDYITADLHYSIFRNRSAYNSSWNSTVGVRGYSIERKYRMYPVEFSQEMKNVEGYLSFDKNFQLKNGLISCGISGSYAKGSGTLFEQDMLFDADAPDFSKYKQLEDMRYLEYEYLTANRFSAGFRTHYSYFMNKEKGTTLYADANIKYNKAISGYYDGKERTAFEIKLGYAF